MIWIIIGVLAVIALILFFNGYQNKYQSMQGTIFNGIMIVFLLFLVLSIVVVYTKNPTKINELKDLTSFVKVYFTWLGNFFGNVKSITGYAVHQDWTNSTGGTT